jgi:hypothetical protein
VPLDETLTLLNASEIAAIHMDPFIAGLLDDAWVC